ncbi:MFS transporter [Ktedonosporobacter rubrisoli]|uniref:MFS transporter n=1 Tax=Ktedonosporobacter rubrisoli TaxID=2509675 RepID=A0A4P6K0S3_KTERU|nr:MFS transporter [Ktedonosporobacter rubrisoli]QBD81413.1 MFS transporter [Ktedonosporobacter rubrisoli]
MQKQASVSVTTTIFSILFAVSFAHLLNDSIQSVIPAMFPLLKQSLQLNFAQVGLIAFALNITASLLQPLVGIFMDLRPKPFLLPIGMCSTLVGMVILAYAPSFLVVLLAVVFVGIGSSVLHPESSRVAFLASGGKRGLAQSLFQIGGNIGQALGPVLTAFIFVPLGQGGAVWFAGVAMLAIIVLFYVARWYSLRSSPAHRAAHAVFEPAGNQLSRRTIVGALAILIALIFSKYVYISSITSYYAFYAIKQFGFSVQQAQLYLFIFLVASVVGTFAGGPPADRFGRRNIIWISILGTAPFAILLPYANQFWSMVLLALAGLILSSAFSIIVVYAQELLPGKVGMVSGLFFGLAFGLGGLGSAVLGYLADLSSLNAVIQGCSYLPLIGLITILLPPDRKLHGQNVSVATTETSASQV